MTTDRTAIDDATELIGLARIHALASAQDVGGDASHQSTAHVHAAISTACATTARALLDLAAATPTPKRAKAPGA